MLALSKRGRTFKLVLPDGISQISRFRHESSLFGNANRTTTVHDEAKLRIAPPERAQTRNLERGPDRGLAHRHANQVPPGECTRKGVSPSRVQNLRLIRHSLPGLHSAAFALRRQTPSATLGRLPCRTR